MNDRPIHHVCYIVDDIPKAVNQWVEMTGAGPFFHLGQHVEFEEPLLCCRAATHMLPPCCMGSGGPGDQRCIPDEA